MTFQKFFLKACRRITLDESLQIFFLSKRSIPSSWLSVLPVLFFNVNYLLIFPFIPIQITLIDHSVEGFPPFVLGPFERTSKPAEKQFETFLLLPYQAPWWSSLVNLVHSPFWAPPADMSTVSPLLLGSTVSYPLSGACLVAKYSYGLSSSSSL